MEALRVVEAAAERKKRLVKKEAMKADWDQRSSILLVAGLEAAAERKKRLVRKEAMKADWDQRHTAAAAAGAAAGAYATCGDDADDATVTGARDEEKKGEGKGG